MMTLFVGRIAYQALPEEQASAFLRAAFPVYYGLLTALSAIGAAALALPKPIEAGILAAVTLTSAFAWLWLLPIAHRLDDLREQGQQVRKELLQTQGRMTFIVVAQIIALVVTIVRLATVH
jgi:polyferredoxin